MKGFAALMIALAAVGCGGSSRGGSPGAGGGGGIGIGGAGGAGCSGLENVGPTVTQVQATGDPPAPLGGGIAVGTYVLTKDEAYPPVSADVPAHTSETISISDTGVDIAVTSDEFPDGFKARANLTGSGTQVTIMYLCGPGAGESFDEGYTDTATELIFISDPGSVRTFTKQ